MVEGPPRATLAASCQTPWEPWLGRSWCTSVQTANPRASRASTGSRQLQAPGPSVAGGKGGLFFELLERLAEVHEREVQAACCGQKFADVNSCHGSFREKDAFHAEQQGPHDSPVAPLQMNRGDRATYVASEEIPARTSAVKSVWSTNLHSSEGDFLDLSKSPDPTQSSTSAVWPPRTSATALRGAKDPNRHATISEPLSHITRISMASSAVVSNRSSHTQRKTELMRRKTEMKAVYEPRNHVAIFVRDNRFDFFIAGMICANAVVMGVEIDNEAMGGYSLPSQVFLALEIFFSVLFTAELVLRLLGEGWRMCLPRERWWFSFDVVLVSLSLFDLSISILAEYANLQMSTSFLTVIKIFRMSRLLRIVRVVRFLTSIRTILMMIAGSMMSLCWLFVILTACTYTFAVVITDGASDWLSPEFGDAPAFDPEYDMVLAEFGTVARTMYTLFQALTNGNSWGLVANRTHKLGVFYFAVFLYYLFFTLFGVLNIVTGVFVDSAIQLADSDRAAAMEKVVKAKANLAVVLTDLMNDMDIDNSGFISWEEWEVAMVDTNIQTLLEVMGIAFHETLELFMILDTSGDGLVEISEFVDGISKVKGQARSLDVHRVMHQVRQLARCIEQMRIQEQEIAVGVARATTMAGPKRNSRAQAAQARNSRAG